MSGLCFYSWSSLAFVTLNPSLCAQPCPLGGCSVPVPGAGCRRPWTPHSACVQSCSHLCALVARKLASCFTHLWSLLHWVSVSCQIQCIQFGFLAPLFCQTSLLIMPSKLPSTWIPFSLSALDFWRPPTCPFILRTRHPMAGLLDQLLLPSLH